MTVADVRARLAARGIQPDSAAGGRFRAAVVALHQRAPGPGASEGDEPEPALAAAAALLELAAAEDGDTAAGELESYLTPDPGVAASAWTVVCYEVGDVSPSAIRDFSHPAGALATLAACDDPAHAAAELLCSTPDGLRWTALTRAGERITFQLPTPETSSPARHRPLGLDRALAAWARQIRAWARRDEPARGAGSEELARAVAALHRRLDGVDERLDAIARTIARLADQLVTLTGPPAEPADDLFDGDDPAGGALPDPDGTLFDFDDFDGFDGPDDDRPGDGDR